VSRQIARRLLVSVAGAMLLVLAATTDVAAVRRAILRNIGLREPCHSTPNNVLCRFDPTRPALMRCAATISASLETRSTTGG
jgi:hypothetical protein